MELVLARSKAGHDKGKLYIVASETEEFVFLTDGVTKKIDSPKKKNKKHVQPIYKIPKEIKPLIESLSTLKDTDSKRIIKIYEKSVNNKEI